MPNTITLSEPDVDLMIGTYLGLQLERGPDPTTFSNYELIASIPYVAGQTDYTYVDSGGTIASWYRTRRYGDAGLLGPYSKVWSVTPVQVPGITLATIEQAVARRCGPYYVFPADRQVPPTSTFERVYVPGLRSNVEQDLVSNMYILRRGRTTSSGQVSVSPADRQRSVAVYDPEQGVIIADTPWQQPPQAGEILEFHHLNPEQELRPAVLAGLRRCFFEDRYSLGQGYIYEADLTASLPWLTNPSWVWRASRGPYPSTFGTPADLPYRVFGQGGHVIIRLQTGWQGPYYGAVEVTVLHPVYNYVNGLDTVFGPSVDDDLLDVNVDYAAAAGHIEAWHLSPARMAAAAAGGLQASQNMAALEFTRQARKWGPQRPDLWRMDSLFGYEYDLTVVNA